MNRNNNTTKAPSSSTKPQQLSNIKKRKAMHEVSEEENKKNVERPSTPPPPASKHSTTPLNDSELAHLPSYERTPGRVGPIKEEKFDVKPDIKPFKGPPGKKVRKTAWEKEEEYKQFCLENEDHVFHELHVCFHKGPNGSPTYDKAGFELDYMKVANWMKPRPYNKSAMVRGMERAVDKAQSEAKLMADIFFEKGEAPENPEYAQGKDYWKDRVSKDLNVPWHKIGVEHFKEWEKRGFKKARRGEYENPSAAEKKRMLRLMSGASLRK